MTSSKTISLTTTRENAPQQVETMMQQSPSSTGLQNIKIYFTVRAECVRAWERMFICGNCAQLGQWLPEKALEMHKDGGDEQQENVKRFEFLRRKLLINLHFRPSIWQASIELNIEESKQMLKFRYFVGFQLQSDPTNSHSAKLLVKLRIKIIK